MTSPSMTSDRIAGALGSLRSVHRGVWSALIGLLVSLSAMAQTSAPLDFQFTLTAPRTTSAGVYAADGTLVRTLWRGEPLLSGTHSRSWNLHDDAGGVAPTGTHTVKVVHHNVRYRWDGVVGSTSAQAGT